jgi:hypothetical protein
MLASLRNIDYPKSKLSINFAVTDFQNAESAQFIEHLKSLLSAGHFNCETSIQTTQPSMDDYERWGPYYAVILNTHALRLSFLRGKYDYFWLLGGDNPPPRGTLKKLLGTDADLTSGCINQREKQCKKFEMETSPTLRYPIYWRYIWTPKDLEDDPSLEPKLKSMLRQAWLEFSFLDTPPQKPDEHVIRNCVFGSGCSLIKREVLEYVGYALGSGGTHSEDLHFCNHVNLRGFDVALNLDAPCLHFDEDGKVY